MTEHLKIDWKEINAIESTLLLKELIKQIKDFESSHTRNFCREKAIVNTYVNMFKHKFENKNYKLGLEFARGKDIKMTYYREPLLVHEDDVIPTRTEKVYNIVYRDIKIGSMLYIKGLEKNTWYMECGREERTYIPLSKLESFKLKAIDKTISAK